MNYKPFLILQMRPEDATADNEFEAILKHGGLKLGEVERIRLEQQENFPRVELSKYSAVIAGGSPFDISTPQDQKESNQKMIEAGFMSLLDQIIDQDFPFLGACSGCGLLGKYCGTPISTKYGEPVSGVDITLTEEGKKDPLLKDMPSSFRVLLGHKEACDKTPHAAVLLASSDSCPVEMFRIKNNVYATQFHPEADPEGFAVRINVYKNHGYFPPEDAAKLIRSLQNEKTPYAQQILKNFVKRYSPISSTPS